MPHLLKNGHPAHVFTDEDRRKGAETTNRRRRVVREAFEDEKFERGVAELLARDEARRLKRRARYLRDRHKRPAPYTADVDDYEPRADRGEPTMI